MAMLVRTLLVLEAAVFGLAVLVHTGVLIGGYEHIEAATAEGVIGLVLFVGFVASTIWPSSSRMLGLVCQGFALVGTFVGLFTIAIGIGPRTALDLVVHSAMIALLVTGIVLVARRQQVTTG
jgi:hypothetical protein